MEKDNKGQRVPHKAHAQYDKHGRAIIGVQLSASMEFIRRYHGILFLCAPSLSLWLLSVTLVVFSCSGYWQSSAREKEMDDFSCLVSYEQARLFGFFCASPGEWIV